MSAAEDRLARDTRLRAALSQSALVERYWAKVGPPTPTGCRLWTGAISGKGHGRVRLGDHVYIAHRVAWAIAHPGEELPELIAHELCDTPLCQEPTHLRASTVRDNTRSYYDRRNTPRSSLRDTRRAAGRSKALRAAVRAGDDVDDTLSAGLSEIDRNQGTLF
uniref:hypothetical protein n=1 Tax=Promicromonospora sp. CA-289581 TaxID=3240013 RepID=UPI003F497C2D